MGQIRVGKRSRRGGEGGQSLLETAILIPVLLSLAFNGVNLGYCWFMVLTMAAVPRQGVQYASQGGPALATISAPSTTAVSNLVYENLTGAISATSSNAQVRVCSSSKGVDSSTGVAQCDSFGPSLLSFSGPDADPEQPVFVLQRVDVAFTVTPIIPGGLFNVILPSNMTFHRQVSMRSLF